MRVRDYLGISRRRQRQLAHAMELTLVGLFFVGLDRGDPGIVVNTLLALAITRLPGLLEGDYGIPMDAGLTLWITAAVFLHVVGTLGPYQNVPGWDHMTHVLSSSLVAAAGYATTRAVDEHSDAVRLPPRFTFVFILLFVLAFGVLWEVLEFGVAGLSTELGAEPVLTQYGLEDTMLDLVFDSVGGLVVAVWGSAHLGGVVGGIRGWFDARAG